ncbi:uncharacterized protein LOC142804023 [Rhipicephalus microplus]|uniref:uncharacterized protein LOC142804023 n=1 Tax=Rhipicephalus microplus TaxID=6941 RepID=UPI003F6BD646
MPDYNDFEDEIPDATLIEFDELDDGEYDDDWSSDSWLSMDSDSDYEQEGHTESLTGVITQTGYELSSLGGQKLESEEEYEDEEESEENNRRDGAEDDELPSDAENDDSELMRNIEELMEMGDSLMQQLEITIMRALGTANARISRCCRFSYRRAP